MGFVSGLLGTAGGAGGTGFAGPQQANLLNPANEQMGKDALAQQLALVNAYQPGGTQALGSQQQLLSDLGQASQGLGPNPALAQLNQATAANTANQAALMAGQRGSAANPALIARQAAMQGAQNQQNAAGQAATMEAQQQIAARQALAQQQAQMIGQQQTGQQQYTGNVLNQTNAQNNANLGMQNNINNVNAGLAGTVMDGQNALMGSLTGAAGSAMGLPAPVPAAEGGIMYAAGGNVSPKPSGPMSFVGRHFSGQPQPMAQGGRVPVLLSPGERKLSPEQAASGANPMKDGEIVPGKPKVGGAKNSYANDTVRDDVEEGTIIIPRSITQSKDAEKKAMDFVRAVMAKNGQLPKKSK